MKMTALHRLVRPGEGRGWSRGGQATFKERPLKAENRRAMARTAVLVQLRYAAAQLLRSPSAARFHWVTFSAIARVDFIAAWLSWA